MDDYTAREADEAFSMERDDLKERIAELEATVARLTQEKADERARAEKIISEKIRMVIRLARECEKDDTDRSVRLMVTATYLSWCRDALTTERDGERDA